MNWQILFDTLGYTSQNGLFYLTKKETWEDLLPKRIGDIIENKLKPYAFFIFQNEPLILFFDNPENETILFEQCWNFNQSPIIFISRGETEIEIYNGFNLVNKKRLEKLGGDEIKHDFDYFKVVTGESWEKYADCFKAEKRIDSYLLKNIKSLRTILKKNIKDKPANFLIGRIVFIRYLIDREVYITFKGEKKKWTNEALCQLLSSKEDIYRFFEEVLRGNLFPIEAVENEIKDNDLQPIVHFLRGNELEKGIISMFDVYDFSIIPIELVSNIYESFIGAENQKKEGAYYTPLFLANYVLNETVGKYFREHQNMYECKILDPACGSGIFLVESLRKIVTQYLKLHPDCKNDAIQYKRTLSYLLTNNIFGIDINENAVAVTVFSLYITLLDYLNPRDIEDFQLPNIENNFFTGNFFKPEAQAHFSFIQNHFQFIVGNPPWKNLKVDSKDAQLIAKYISKRAELEQLGKEKIAIGISYNQIAQAFMLRVSDFQFAQCAFVLPSKTLYNLKAQDFRSYFLQNFQIQKVLELSSVRKEIFDDSNDPAIAPASILFYNYSPHKEANKKNTIEHISLKPNRFFSIFKLLLIQKYDIKKVAQRFFMENDWLWKILVYGNVLDFYFVKNIKDRFESVESVIANKQEFIYGVGMTVGGEDENDVSHFKGLPFIDAQKKQLRPFCIEFNPNSKWEIDIVHRPSNEKLFEGNSLLIKKGLNNSFESSAAICRQKAVFKDTILAIQVLCLDKIHILESTCAIFNSDFYSYYLLMTASNIGIERESVQPKERLLSPYISSENLLILTRKIEIIANEKLQIEKKEGKSSYSYQLKQQEYDNIYTEIEAEIENLFGVSSQEKALLNYAQEISIPLIQRKNWKKILGKLALQKEGDRLYLEQYANIFIEHFNNIYHQNGNYFEVEIWHSEYTIGMFFKVIGLPSQYENQIVWYEDKGQALSPYIKMSHNSLSENLFVQKDIKGFEKTCFYVIKPNEYKCWHSAVAYLDLQEFMSAILKSGAKKYKEREYVRN